jgi:hypothetical protein
VYPYANPASEWQSWPNAKVWTWRMAVSDYLGNYTTADKPPQLVCPANPWEPYGGVNNQSRPPCTYGFAPAFPNNWHDASGVNPAVDPSHYVDVRKDNQIKDASAVLFMGEVPNGNATGIAPYKRTFLSNLTEVSPFYMFNSGYAAYWFDDAIAGRPTPSPGNPIAMTPHNIGWNSLLVDGHVERHSRYELVVYARDVWVAAAAPGRLFWQNK